MTKPVFANPHRWTKGRPSGHLSARPVGVSSPANSHPEYPASGRREPLDRANPSSDGGPRSEMRRANAESATVAKMP